MIRRSAFGPGFTLIELLFVVAIIAVMAAIAVPNFLEAQVRSKVSRTRVDMAEVDYALKRYYSDYGVYPPHRPEVREFLAAAEQHPIMDSAHTSTPAEARFSWFRDDPEVEKRAGREELLTMGYSPNSYPYYPIMVPARYDLTQLTTPIAYMVRLPTDTFSDKKQSPFTYINFSDDFGSTETVIARRRAATEGSSPSYLLLSPGPDADDSAPNWHHPLNGPWLPYDPTNGTSSAGEIFSLSKRHNYTEHNVAVTTDSRVNTPVPYDDNYFFRI